MVREEAVADVRRLAVVQVSASKRWVFLFNLRYRGRSRRAGAGGGFLQAYPRGGGAGEFRLIVYAAVEGVAAAAAGVRGRKTVQKSREKNETIRCHSGKTKPRHDMTNRSFQQRKEFKAVVRVNHIHCSTKKPGIVTQAFLVRVGVSPALFPLGRSHHSERSLLVGRGGAADSFSAVHPLGFIIRRSTTTARHLGCRRA
jgi:hypothetical protein